MSFDGRSVQALKPLLVFEPQRQIGDEPEEKPKGPQRENPGVSLLAAFRHLAEALCRSEASGVYGLSIGNVKMDLGVG